MLPLAGCFHSKVKGQDKFVFVTAKQAILRDRVAAVSNRTGTVNNGEKLVVLEHSRRFLKVRSPRGEVGWVEEKLTAGQEIADRFEELRAKHAGDPVVATATARDEVYLHVSPGRETERFFRLAEGDSLSLLERATVEKAAAPGSAPSAAKAAAVPVTKPGKPAVKGVTKPLIATPEAPAAPPAPSMEDWWLVRDGKGQMGWIYARMIDVSEPEALSRYAEGQRIVGAYVLNNVDDPESGMMKDGQTVTSIPQYVTVLSPFKAGLPYDFDQVRVFTWNLKKHRYETAFRERNIAGYLPVKIEATKDPYSKAANASTPLPGFTFRVLSGDAPIPTPSPADGTLVPAKTISKTYRIDGNLCRRVVAPGPQPAEGHPAPEPAKAKKGKKK